MVLTTTFVYAATDAATDTSTSTSSAEVTTTDAASGNSDAASSWQEKRTARKAAIEAKKLEIKEMIEAKKEETKANIEAKLEEKKEQAVNRIQTRLAKINTRRATYYLNMLDHLTKITDKIQSHADTLFENHGFDQDTQNAIDATYDVITSAQLVVEEQQGKTYEITVSSDETVKSEVKAVRDLLHTDLTSTKSTIHTTRDTVQNTFQIVKNYRSQVITSTGE